MLKKLFLLIILVGFCTCIRSNSDSGIYQVISHMIYASKANIVEYGVQTSFETSKSTSEKELTDNIFNLLAEGDSTIVTKSEQKTNIYSINFQGDKASGYVQGSSTASKTNIMINLMIKGTQDELNSLKQKMDKIIAEQKNISNIHSYFYLKGEIKKDNSKVINDTIIDDLNYMGVINIDTVSLNNGFSTVCYTGSKDNINNSGKLMDLNFAVMNYNNGIYEKSYLFVGTPMINISY
ncbi:MAG TPA: YwmB family TATA-box binding protein [Clostridiaceae bacterium]